MPRGIDLFNDYHQDELMVITQLATGGHCCSMGSDLKVVASSKSGAYPQGII